MIHNTKTKERLEKLFHPSHIEKLQAQMKELSDFMALWIINCVEGFNQTHTGFCITNMSKKEEVISLICEDNQGKSAGANLLLSDWMYYNN